MMDDGDDVDWIHVSKPFVISNSDFVHVCYDETTDDSLATAVVDAVASAAECEPLEVEPLYRRIDPDALESIFASSAADTRQGAVSFVLEGHLVTVVDGVDVYVTPQ